MRLVPKPRHRGIVPVIATAVIIMTTAIAGAGTLVFAQDMFDSEQISFRNKVESAKIVGYDARDLSRLQDHNGIYTASSTAGVSDGKISKTERLAVYFQNDSIDKIWITDLRFAGSEYRFVGETNNIDEFASNALPGPGEYVILTNKPDSLVTDGDAGVESGELVTLVLGLDDTIINNRAVQIKITTTSGVVIIGNVKVGNYHSTTAQSKPIGFTTTITPPEPPLPECNSVPIDFETDAFGNPLSAGTEVGSQWHLIDIHISGINDHPSHPDKVIIFDSNNPTGGDWDLGSPWDSGNLGSNTDLGNLLIIAEDDVDSNGDGLVDDPDDEAQGGAIIFTSIYSCSTLGFDLIDFEQNQGNSGYVVIDIEEGGSITFDFRDFASVIYGDNSANRVFIPANEIPGTYKKVEFHFIGSGAIDNVLLG